MSSRMNNVLPAERVDTVLRVLAGALQVWGVAGTVTVDEENGRALLIDSEEGVHLAVHHDAAAGWEIAMRDPASGARMALAHHAGLPGLLRSLRTELAPDAPRGRLIIGSA